MKHKALFSLKDKSEKIKVSSAAISLGSLRVNKIFSILKRGNNSGIDNSILSIIKISSALQAINIQCTALSCSQGEV